MLNELKLVQPTTLYEASKALTDYGESAKIYAGGAELLLLMRQGLMQTEVLVDVKKIERLQRVTWNGNGVRAGASVTHRELATTPLIREQAPALAFAESQVANVRVRNQGTLGGNLCFNDPHSDPGTALLLHEAEVVLARKDGHRQIPLSDFLSGMYSTGLEPGELLQKVFVAPLPVGW